MGKYIILKPSKYLSFVVGDGVFMTNETYRMAKQAIQNAAQQRRSRCIGFVRPSNQGKTHTAHIISRDLGATIIPVMSITEQRTWFADRLDRPVFIFDDPSDWFVYIDRLHIFSLMKNLISGWLKSGRATKFDFNVPVPIDKKVCILIFMNEEQYNMIRQELKMTGLAARMELYFTRHDEAITDKIEFEYADKNYSGQNLPHFKDFDEEKYDKQFLNSHKEKRYYNEDVEFK